MVKIHIIMEGGAPNTNSTDETLNNSNALRQSLNRIFSEILGEEVSIVLTMQHGYREAAKVYINQTYTTTLHNYLYVDLDDTRNRITEWFTKLATENPVIPIVFSEEQKKNVYFMIQAMEAWMLYQPDAIERWANLNYTRKREGEPFAVDLQGKHIENIPHPDSVVNTLLSRYFKYIKDGKEKKTKYRKLTSASGILDQLDAKLLQKQDTELNRLANTIPIQ